MHVYVVNQVINLHNLSYFLLRKALFLQALAEGLNQKLMKGIGRSAGILIIVIVQNLRNAWLVPLSQNFIGRNQLKSDCKKLFNDCLGLALPIHTSHGFLTYTAIFSYINLQEDGFLGLIILIKGSNSHLASLSNIRNSSCLIAFFCKDFSSRSQELIFFIHFHASFVNEFVFMFIHILTQSCHLSSIYVILYKKR